MRSTMQCDIGDDNSDDQVNIISADFSDRANELDDRSIADKIESIRAFLQNKPKNARAMAKLACLISKEKSIHQQIDADSPMFISEAIELAEKSIATAPTKPYGYTAMSIVHPDLKVRMQSLRMAIQQCSNKDQYNLAMIDLMVRLLTEHRFQKSLQSGQLTNYVTNDEQSIIKQLNAAFNKVWKDSTVTRDVSSMEFVGSREYRLGRFFRKLEPSHIYRAMSRFYFEKAIEHLPHNDTDYTMAHFWLATIKPPNYNDAAQPPFTKCPAEYIVGLYSTFAPKFDNLLVDKLEYETPKILRLLHDRTVLEPLNHPIHRRYRAIADLGCGTGLSGLAFASLLLNDVNEIGEMTGVDLSPEMLSFAEKTNCYKKLVTGDILSILNDSATWDLVLACDVFCYIGDLSHVFRMVHSSLMQDGLFVFSTEKASDLYAVPFHLHECARFAHNKDYIASLGESTGFETVAMQVCPIRKNKGRDVTGILTILKKQ
jgi:predicted TPR repeat methyltransferase